MDSCVECVHYKICPAVVSMNSFINGLGKFWAKLKVPPDTHPVVVGSREFLCRYCAHKEETKSELST